MAPIGIIACEVLELEIAQLLSNECKINDIIVIENKQSRRFIEYLNNSGNKNIFTIPHLKSLQRESGGHIDVIVYILSIQLHRSRKTLANAICKTIQSMHQYVGSFFIGYGLCGTALINFEEYIHKGTPVVTLSDCEPVVDDCIGLIIGGREKYYAEQCKKPGTFYITPGWANHWNQIFENNTNEEHKNQIIKMFKRYNRMLIIENSVMPENEIREKVIDLNRMLCLDIEIRKGATELLEKSWNRILEKAGST